MTHRVMLRISLLACIGCLFALGCNEDESPTQSKNHEPNKPEIVVGNHVPQDMDTGIIRSPLLQWTCSDPDNDPLTYDVYLGTTVPPLQVDTARRSNYYQTNNLVTGTVYYWKIVAEDPDGERTSGGIWQFKTR